MREEALDNIIEELTQLDSAKCTGEDVRRLLHYSSSAHRNKHIRLMANSKLQMIMTLLPAEVRKECVELLFKTLENGGDALQVRAALDALHALRDPAVDNHIKAVFAGADLYHDGSARELFLYHAVRDHRQPTDYKTVTEALLEQNETEEALAIIKKISLVDHRNGNMKTIFDLLFYASSACKNKYVRRSARFKMSLTLSCLPAEERNKCLERLVEELKTCKDSWLERNILESIYSHLDNATLADIIPHLAPRVRETFNKLCKGQTAAGLLHSVSQRCLNVSKPAGTLDALRPGTDNDV
jgi:hypothetical protein